jgi:hypothetical protein
MHDKFLFEQQHHSMPFCIAALGNIISQQHPPSWLCSPAASTPFAAAPRLLSVVLLQLLAVEGAAEDAKGT